MSIPTQVFENGHWVTRYADIHHVLAQNRDSETNKVKEAVEVPEVPSMGLLTRTIVRTPIVKWIIPARIRHPERNDVLYITADSVEIKEAHGDYTLQHVATKDDFDSPIKAARICGLQRELTKPDINAIIRKEDHWQDIAQSDSMEYLGQPMDEDTDSLVKEEVDRIVGTVKESVNDADMQSLQSVPLQLRTLSPHILILALDSGKLVFMYTVNGDAENPHIVTSQCALWKGQRPLLDQVGRHIAVDPRSRAIAVAAQENLYYIYTLKPWADLQKEVRRRPQIHPLCSERAFEVDGTVLKMEFLYPSQNDPDRIVLLLVICKNGRSRLVWHDWNSASPLAQIHMKPSSQVLPPDERMPLLLIPTIAFTAFIVVCEKSITLYRDLLTGTPLRYTHELHEVLEPEEAGSSRRKPIWVQWARVLRSTTHRAQGDGVYLCREDGIVHFLDIKHGHPSLIDSTHEVGKLDTDIDTGFAVLDIGPHSSDLLAAAGDGSEGGLWKFDAREHPRQISKDSNWTPVVDCCTAMVRKKPKLIGMPLDQKQVYQQRIFACVGKARHGAISEFRYGIPASRYLTVPLKDLLYSGVLAVWAFRDMLQDTIYITLSHPKQTFLLRIHFGGDEDKSFAELVENDQALGLSERTIMIKALPGGHIVQVTERALWTSSFSAIDDIHAHGSFRHGFGTARILAACIGVPGSETLTLIAFEDHGTCHLQLAHVTESYNEIGEMLELDYQLTAVALMRFADDVFAIVGSLHAMVETFILRKDSKEWQSVSTYTFEGDFAICNSIAVSLPAAKGGNEFAAHIACGLRDGSVHVLRSQRRTIAHETLYICSEDLGDTPVSVTATVSNPRRFIAQVESDIFSLEVLEHGKGFMNVYPIFLTDDEKPEWQQGQVSSMSVVQGLEEPSTSANVVELVCLDREYIHVAQSDSAGGPKNVHRRINVGGTPTRAVYSERLRKLIVLNHRTTVTRSSRMIGSRRFSGKRTLRPVITFLDPDNAYDEGLDDTAMDLDTSSRPNILSNNRTNLSGRHQHENPPYESGERFLGIVEWFPKVGDKEFHMLVVHTMIKTNVISEAKGRLLLFSVQVLGEGIELILKKETPPATPIYAVAVHPDRTSLVYHTGDELRLLRLENTVTGLKWSDPVKAQLRSPARHITIKVPYIFVSTAGNSLAIFVERDGFLEFFANDTVARQGLYHLNLKPRGLIVVADMGNSITGMWRPPNLPRIDHSLSTLFEASLPQAVSRLQAIRLPIWHPEGGASIDVEGPEENLRQRQRGHRVLIGIATTGTITKHRLLNPDQWPLLRFIQNLAERSPIICPFPDGVIRRHLDPARSTKPETRAINGDILARLLKRGGIELFSQMMNGTPPIEERYMDFASVKDRRDKFKELLAQYWSTMPTQVSPEYLEDDRRVARTVLEGLEKWVSDML